MRRSFLPHLAARIFNTPLAIDPAKLDAILAAIPERLGLPGEAAAYDGEQQKRRPYAIDGGVAIVDVMGTLVHRASGMEAMSGMTSYESLRSEMKQALSDPDVKSILLRVDSPGGEVAGLFDFADELHAARGAKPIYAIAEDLAASAAYAIASAADRLYVTRTGQVGSIGVIATHMDVSRAAKNQGVEVEHVIAGKHKADGSPYDPEKRPAGLAKLQERVNAVYEEFTSDVARNRGVSQAAVKATEAAVFDATKATELGLADGVRTFADVLAEMKGLQASVERGAPYQSKGVRPISANGGAGGSGSVHVTVVGTLDEATAAALQEQLEQASTGHGGVRLGDTKDSAEIHEEEIRMNELEKLKAELERISGELALTKAKIAEKDLAIEGLKQQLAASEKVLKTSIIDKHVRAGRVLPAQIAAAQALGDAKSADELDTLLSAWPVQTHAKPVGAAATVEQSAETAAKSEKEPVEALQEKATAIKLANPKLSEADAFTQAIFQNPDLYNAYREKRAVRSRR